MITIEKIQNLDGSISIPTSQILYFSNGKMITGDGAEISLIGGTTGGGTGGGTNPVEIQDTTLEYTPIAIDAATNNTIEISQDSGQGDFSKYQFVLTQNEFSLAPTSSSSFNLSKVEMNIKTVGYQLIKILLYDENDTLITFNRVDLDTVQKTSNNTVKIDMTSSGFMLVTNATYELANIFNTDKMPIAATGGWYALTSNTDANAAMVATFSSPVTVSKVRIYRCGAASTSFNGGTDVYTVKFTDSSNNVIKVDVPKVPDASFTQISSPTIASLGSTGEAPTLESKQHKFTLGVSTDGTNFTDITANGVLASVQNPTTLLYSTIETFPVTTLTTKSQKLYFKVPDADIAFLKNLKINMWRTENV